MLSAGRLRSHTSTLLVIVSVVVLLASNPVVGAVDSVGSPATFDAEGQPFDIAVQNGTANNTTVQHRNPDTTEERGNLGDVQKWLSDRMVESLSQSTIHLSQSQYQRARTVLGDQYSDRFEKFVDIAGETEGVDTETARTLNETRTTQRQYIQTVEEFQDLQDEYQEAKQAGNETRARRLARRIAAQGDRIQSLNTNLQRHYTDLTNTTGVSTADTSQRIEDLTTNITTQQQDIVTAELVRTTLTITPNSSNASFRSPLVLSGTIRTAGDHEFTPNRSHVQLTIGDQQLRTDVRADGSFVVQYRPTTVRRGTRTITVEYRPRTESLYLGSTANTTVAIQQVVPSLSVTSSPHAKFGQRFTVSGRVTVDGAGASSVPIIIAVGETRLGRVQTTANGTYRYTTAFPAVIKAGNQSVTATIPLRNRAIAPAHSTDSIRVLSTGTNLSLNGTWQTAGLTLKGALETSSGRPVADEVIRLSVNGTTVTTVRTNASGQYAATVTPPAGSGHMITVRATYDGAGNLKRARTATNLTIPATQSTGPVDAPNQQGSRFLSDTIIIAVGVLVILLLLVAGYVWHRYDRDTVMDEKVEPESTTSATSDSGSDTVADELTPAAVLASARTASEQGQTDRAVQLAYIAVRRSLSDVGHNESSPAESMNPSSTPQTHWEFYTTYADSEVADALHDLTLVYEQAAFAPTNVDQSQARQALTAAETILDRTHHSS